MNNINSFYLHYFCGRNFLYTLRRTMIFFCIKILVSPLAYVSEIVAANDIRTGFRQVLRSFPIQMIALDYAERIRVISENCHYQILLVSITIFCGDRQCIKVRYSTEFNRDNNCVLSRIMSTESDRQIFEFFSETDA